LLSWQAFVILSQKQMRILVNIILIAFAVMVTASILPGVEVSGFRASVVVAVVLALINALIKPVLVILTIPITIVSLGLFLLVINAGMVMLADFVVDGFEVNGFWWALAFSLIMSLTQSVFGLSTKPEKPV